MSKLNILVAYPYAKPELIKEIQRGSEHIRFVLDSGAFTAWKAGKPIHLDDYCRFIESLPFEPWRYFTLDVIGDAHGTMKNYETMLSRGFKPVPIFTRGEDPSMIDEYYKTSEVVGIGGLVGTPGNKGFVKGIMTHVKGRKVHWLGFASDPFVFHYRPYMCDSSSWSSGFRYANSKVYVGGGKWLPFTKANIKSNKTVFDSLRYHGLDPISLTHSSAWINGKSGINPIQVLTYRTWVNYQREVKKKFDVNFFLAVCGLDQMVLFNNAFIYWKDRGVI